MDELGKLLGKVAPWLVAAAGGPAGLATKAISTIAEKLGASDQTIDAVTQAVAGATPEQIEKLRLADLDFKLRMQELGFKQTSDLAAIAAADRKDAREMLKVTRSWVPAALSCAITLGYFAILSGMMTGALKVSDSQALLLMLGSLSTAWGMVMAFWFGTTHDSGRKTDMLAKAEPVR